MVVVLAVLIVPSLVQKANTSQLTYNTFLTKLSRQAGLDGHGRPEPRA